MEGPVEVKDSRQTTDEPIKAEGPVQSPDSSERSDGATSPPPNCSICLGKLVNTSFTDSCLHQFCFTCLLQWSKIKTECPLCKQTFKSIIHNVRSEEDYDQYHVPRELASQIQQPQVMATLDVNFEVEGNWDVGVLRYLYRTTMSGNRRHGVLLNPEQVARREQLPSMAPQVSRDEQRHRRTNPIVYRRTVYRLGMRATSLPDVFGRFRECSAEYYRRQPRELDRIVPWLNREIQVLLNNNASHVAYVMRVIMDALTQHDIRSPQFLSIVRPFFTVYADHFVHELLNYARTNFDLVGYDQSVTYLPQGFSSEYVPRVVSPTSSSSSTTSDDSDVRVLDEAIDLRVNNEMPGVGPHPVSLPNPVTVGSGFQLDISYNVPDVLTVSSNSTSDDECEVVGYVKPRHERTPEIIELISSDPEDINITLHEPSDNIESYYGEAPQPSTSHNTKRRSTRKNYEISRVELSEITSSSTNTNSDPDSDYSPRRNRRCPGHVKKSSKKSTSDRKYKEDSSTRTRNKTTRNISSSGESDSRKRNSRRTTRMKIRISSSSESSFHENEKKKVTDDRGKKEKSSTRATAGMRTDVIKREEKYSDDETTSTCGSSSETESRKKNRSCKRYKSKRKYSTNSTTDTSTERNAKLSERKDKARQSFDDSSLRNSGISRSSSETSFKSDKNKKSKHKHRGSQRISSDCHEESQEDSIPMSRKLSRNEHGSKRKVIDSTSDSEVDHIRSSSQCSNHSSKTHGHWKKTKHKERYRSKQINHSCSRSFNPYQSTSSATSSTTGSSFKTMGRLSSKHSDPKSSSTYKDKYKSHRNHKESKYRRSQSESKTKSKKKRRRIRSSSSPNSE